MVNGQWSILFAKEFLGKERKKRKKINNYN